MPPSADPHISEEINTSTDEDTLGLGNVDQDLPSELNPSTGRPLRWRSHKNEISTRDFKIHTGKEIGPGHEIWDHLRPGDRLGVWMNAQYGGWECHGMHANIEVWKIWEPKLM